MNKTSRFFICFFSYERIKFVVYSPHMLDKDQQRAVRATEGPVCIMAGPGSGKTFTIVERIRYLLGEKRVSPERILAITFTNKAARELRTRLEKTNSQSCPLVTTFHALCHQILREHGEHMGMKGGVLLVSDGERQAILKRVADEGGVSVRDLSTLISQTKLRVAVREESVLVRAYQDALSEKGLIDFDDLLLRAHQLFRKHPEVLRQYQYRFYYVLVDEYQDTNDIQAEIVSLIATPQDNLCVIGDPNQSIYGFRGACPESMSVFSKRYPDARTVMLSRNYRSVPAIINAADSMMKKEGVWCVREGSERVVEMASLGSAREEAEFIARAISTLTGGLDMQETDGASGGEEPERTYHISDICVLFRLHALGHELSRVLTRAAIPHRIVGERSFFDRPEIRKALEAHARTSSEGTVAAQLERAVEESGLQERYEDGTPAGSERYDRVLELITHASLYGHLSGAEGREALFAEAALSHPEDEGHGTRKGVTLMSVHAAKGLEFPVVFVVGVEEGLFPYVAQEREDSMEERVKEEQRLLYVAMTRAKDVLYLTHARRRTLFGSARAVEPSRFLDTLSGETVRRSVVRNERREARTRQVRLF